MAEFVEVMRNLARICEASKCGSCIIEHSEYRALRCGYPMFIEEGEVEELEKTVMEWEKEHPVQTNKDKFIEVFGVLDRYRTDSSWWDKEYKAPTEGE